MILVDLDKKSFSFGHKDQMVYASKYKIFHVDEKWITAITMKAYSIGTGVYVLNLVNGEYLAGVLETIVQILHVVNLKYLHFEKLTA